VTFLARPSVNPADLIWPNASVEGNVYFVEAAGRRMVKIGYATNVNKRIRTLQIGSPDRLVLVHVMPGTRETESLFHGRFQRYRARGEWFYIAGRLAQFLGYHSEFNPEKELTLSEAAKYSGVSERTIRRLVHDGLLDRDIEEGSHWFTLDWLETQFARGAFESKSAQRARAWLEANPEETVEELEGW
jgi:hypothetical protein